MSFGLYMPRYIYNYRRQPIDRRDHKFMVPLKEIPPNFDLASTKNLPEVLDQGDLGSCTANATSNALRYCLNREDGFVFQPSRLYIYYYSRLLEGTTFQDSGANVRDVMKAISYYGACDEAIWPYEISKFCIHPSRTAINNGRKHEPEYRYESIDQNLVAIKNTLARQFPVIMGFEVFSSLEDESVLATGVIQMPDTKTETSLGGHCVILTGYDDSTQRFTFMNSWGKYVGDKGFFTIPYAYVADPDLASDFWTINFFI